MRSSVATLLSCSLAALFAGSCRSRTQDHCRLDSSTNGSPARRVLDINCDGYADAVQFAYPLLQVFAGGPNGLPTTPSQTIDQTAPFGGHVTGAPLADINGDGFADLVVVRPSTEGTRADTVIEYFGSRAGLADSPRVLVTQEVVHVDGFGSERMETADFNGDGFADLALQTGLGWTPFRMTVFLGSPDGLRGDAWSTIEEMNGGEHGPFWSIVGSGDFDADGYADVLLEALGDVSHVTVFRGTPNGLVESTSAPIVSTLFADPRMRLAWVPGDLNGDHYSDAIAISRVRGSLDVFFGGPHGFATSASQTIAPPLGEGFAELLAWGDMNGDGMDDALAASVVTGGERRVVLLTGSVNGPAVATYWSISDPAMGTNGHGIEARDFDADGFADTVLGWRTTEDAAGTTIDHAIIVRGGAVGPSTPDQPFTVSGGQWE